MISFCSAGILRLLGLSWERGANDRGGRTKEGGIEVEHAMTTTAFSIEGYRIVRTLGVIRGIVVRSRSIFGTIGASIQTLAGGNISLFTELCEKTRDDAFETMLRHAWDLGANAVIGIRYDATEIMSGVTEVLCYGTAVVVEPSSIEDQASL